MKYALGFYLHLLINGWQAAGNTRHKSLPWRRWLILLIFWPLFLLIEGINAICLQLDNRLYPAYRQVSVKQPVFIIGMPRSGTTFLHRLLAKDDDRFTTTTLWELIFAPSILQRRFWGAFGRLDKLLGRPFGRIVFGAERLLLGWLDDVHQTGLQSPEEDFLGLLPVGGCFLLVLLFPQQALWQLAYFDRDLPPGDKKRILRFYHGLVQRHLYCHGTDRIYLSKNPSFSPMVQGLAETFADARFIACFRNPTDAVPSQISSILNATAIIDPGGNDSYWRDHLSALLQFYCRHLLDYLPGLPENRQAIVTMEALSQAPAQTIKELYQRLNLPVTTDYDRALEEEQIKARHYQSMHQYSLNELAISAEELTRRFSFVYDYFHYPQPETRHIAE